MSSRHTYRRLYVWEMPVRVYHWLNALSISVLGVTGFLIGKPFTAAEFAAAVRAAQPGLQPS